MFALLGDTIACLIWAFLITTLVATGLFLILKEIKKQHAISVVGILLFIVFYLCLFFQSTLLCGALYAKSYVADLQLFTQKIISKATVSATDSSEEVQLFKQQLTNEYPPLGRFIDNIPTEGFENSSQSTPDLIGEEIKSIINYYLLRRVCWMIGFCLLSGVMIYYAGDGQPKRTKVQSVRRRQIYED